MQNMQNMQIRQNMQTKRVCRINRICIICKICKLDKMCKIIRICRIYEICRSVKAANRWVRSACGNVLYIEWFLFKPSILNETRVFIKKSILNLFILSTTLTLTKYKQYSVFRLQIESSFFAMDILRPVRVHREVALACDIVTLPCKGSTQT